MFSSQLQWPRSSVLRARARVHQNTPSNWGFVWLFGSVHKLNFYILFSLPRSRSLSLSLSPHCSSLVGLHVLDF